VPFESMDGVQLFARIARELAEQPDHAHSVQRLVELAVQLVGCDMAAVWELTPSRATVLRATTDAVLGRALDSILTTVDEGIARQALATRSTIVMEDLALERRWPSYRAAVVDSNLPIRSAVVYSLDVGELDLGALALYSGKPGFFGDEMPVDIGGVLAEHAAIALEATYALDKAGHLEAALESNRKIGMAIGILMAEHKLTGHQAFDLLRTASQCNHVKLRELAEHVVLTGEAPSWPTGRRRPG
jgi:GAF domain-containing protein